VTLDRSSGGPDDSFSLEPPELAQLVKDSRTAWEALGQVTYERQQAEQANVQYRRSLYVVKALRQGELITAAHVRSIRPGFGLAPEHAAGIIGRRAARDAAYGTPVSWDLVAEADAAS
jgi:N-acetylneuraminate synthase